MESSKAKSAPTGDPARVLLVNPGTESWISLHPPLQLGTIASYIRREGIPVRIVDEAAGQNVRQAVREFDPDIVGITATTPLIADAYRIADDCRKLGKLTVLGGKHVSVLPEEALQHVDIVVRFEGEQAMLDIARGERARVVERPYIKDLDSIPPPAWDLMDMEFYVTAPDRLPRTHLGFLSPGTRTANLITTRGCPYKCIFCYNSWSNTPMRFHSPRRVVDDIRYLVEHYRIGALYLMDDDIFCHRKRLRQICELLLEENVQVLWGAQATSDHLDEDVLRLARTAGLRQVGFGFESGSQRILDLLKNSRTTVEQNARALRLCREVGVTSFPTYMVGSPTETLDDIQMTIDFIRNNPIDHIGVHITTPYPGTELWKMAEQRGLVPDAPDWRQFTSAKPTIPICENLSLKDLERIRDEIDFMAKPMTIGQILRRAMADPKVLLQPLKNPRQVWRAIRRMQFRAKRSSET